MLLGNKPPDQIPANRSPMIQGVRMEGIHNNPFGPNSTMPLTCRAVRSTAAGDPIGPKPKTKAGKQRVVKRELGRFAQGKLHSGGSGKLVTSRKQAVAIALSEAGLSRRRKR